MRATPNNPAAGRISPARVLLSATPATLAGRRAKLDLSRMYRVIPDKFRLNPERSASALDLRSLERDAVLCPLLDHGNGDGTGRIARSLITASSLIIIREIGVAVYR
jgi:hypothetical protein